MSENEGQVANDLPNTAEAPAIPEGAMDEVLALLRRLDPPETVELQDVYGNTFTVRPVLSARKQIAVLRHAEKLMKLGAGDTSTMAVSGIEDIGAVLIRLSDNEEVLNVLCAAFEAAHPHIVVNSRDSATDAGDAPEGGGVAHVADLFAIEEIVGGLVPFCIRLATKLLSIAQAVVPTAATGAAAKA